LNETFLAVIKSQENQQLLFNLRLTDVEILEFCNPLSPHSGKNETEKKKEMNVK